MRTQPAGLRAGRVLLCVAGLLMFLLPLAATTGPTQHGHNASPPEGYLGVDVRDVSKDRVGPLHLKSTRGAEIIRVDHDGPAGKMGLHEHDVVLEMNGTKVDNQDRLRKMLRDTPPGRSIRLLVSRDGQPLTLSATMGDRTEVERQVWQAHLAMPGATGVAAAADGDPYATPPAKGFLSTLLTSPTYTGAQLEGMSPQLSLYFGASKNGLLVRSVDTNSPAQMAGLRAGDVVTQANLRPINSTSAWTRMIKEAKGKPVSLTIMRDHQDHTLTLIPDVKHK